MNVELARLNPLSMDCHYRYLQLVWHASVGLTTMCALIGIYPSSKTGHANESHLLVDELTALELIHETSRDKSLNY